VTSTIPAAGNLPTTAGPTVGATTITFNGTAAAIIYTGSAATSVQVPYEVAGSAMANVVLTVGTQSSKIFTIPVAPTSPGIFTTDFTGGNGVVALNADGTVNSAANPAARGATVTLFATGEGVTNPADADGVVETTSTRVPVAPVSVTIGGAAAAAGSGGSTPKDISGVLMMTVTVPASIPAGAANVVLTAGGVASTQTAVLYVK
jgi:uncharacterized protein (TIGR03437 family)